MSYTSFLGILSLKLIFSLSFPSLANANSSSICQIKRNYRTYTNTSRSNYTGIVTRSGEITCQQINRYTYQITINGQTRFVHRSAIISARPDTAITRSLRPVARPTSNVAPAVVLPSSINEPLRSAPVPAAQPELPQQVGVQRIQNGIIGSPTMETTPEVSISSATAPEPEVSSEVPEETAAEAIPEVQRPSQPTTHLLEISGWVTPRSEPNRDSRFECSVVVEGSCSRARAQVATIDHNVDLMPTGERVFDEDNREWYFKANFEHGNQSYSAWFAEKQTEIDPNEAIVRSQTAQRVQNWLNGSGGSTFGPNVEVAGSEPAPYQLSMEPAAIAGRNDTVQRSNEQFVAEAAAEAAARAARERQSSIARGMFMSSSRGLIAIHNARRGLCGSYDYSPTAGQNSYAHPVTACAVARLTQTWREQYCPNGGACRLEFGNISHATIPRFNISRTHTDGYCMDIRPIRTSGSGSLTINSSNYDREKTAQLIGLLTRMGGTSRSRSSNNELIIFNDSGIRSRSSGERLTRSISGHDNHIHVCFRPDNPVVRSQCADFQPNERICGDSGSTILFAHPLMEQMRSGLGN